jgi:hypothetical protein
MLTQTDLKRVDGRFLPVLHEWFHSLVTAFAECDTLHEVCVLMFFQHSCFVFPSPSSALVSLSRVFLFNI